MSVRDIAKVTKKSTGTVQKISAILKNRPAPQENSKDDKKS